MGCDRYECVFRSGDCDQMRTGRFRWKWSLPTATCPNPTAPGKYWVGDNAAIYSFENRTKKLDLLAGADRAPGRKTGGLKEARFSDIYGIVSTRDASRLFVTDSTNHELKMITLIPPASKPNNFEAVSTLASGKSFTANDKRGPAFATLCFDASPGSAGNAFIRRSRWNRPM